MAANGISTEVVMSGPNVDPIATRIKRRGDKLALAVTERAAVGTPGYRTLHTIAGTHNAYVAGTVTAESGSGSPTAGHPWS